MLELETFAHISKVPLPNDSIHEHLEETSLDIQSNVIGNPTNMQFSLQSYESIDTSSRAQLLSFVRFVYVVDWKRYVKNT